MNRTFPEDRSPCDMTTCRALACLNRQSTLARFKRDECSIAPLLVAVPVCGCQLPGIVHVVHIATTNTEYAGTSSTAIPMIYTSIAYLLML